MMSLVCDEKIPEIQPNHVRYWLIIITPNITTGNALFKLMVLGMGCCAGGLVVGARVPILLTSRSQEAAARLGSAALGAISAHQVKKAL